MSGPELITLGCRLNAAESEAMRALAGGEDDLVIVNSCAVTNEAVRQTRQAIRKAKRSRPHARIFVTGCAAQVEPETFAAMPEVDRVLGNKEKFEPSSFRRTPESQGENAEPFRPEIPAFAGMTAKIRVSDIMAVRETAPHLVAGFAERARAFVEVQNGCDHRCTFCIIPYGRGGSRSVPAGLVVERIRALVGDGRREVVLTGVDVTSYGPDLPGAPTLGQLVERILRHVPELPRLRLSSLDCIEMDERLFDLACHEPRFMPHLHMSFQAGDDLVLKRMKRRHSRASAVDMVARLKARRPQMAIGADLIAGFPTETEAMHANSLALIDECDIVMGHIFPFSPKRGTPAALMPQVEPKVVKERARRLREACARRKAAWLQGLVGTRQRVLVEKAGFGHAENFAPVFLRHSRLRGNDEGKIVEVTITRVESDTLIGVPRVTDIPWYERMRAGFQKTSDRLGDNLSGLLTKAALDAQTLDEIEEALVATDLGPATAAKVRSRLAEERFPLGVTEAAVREVVAQELEKILEGVAEPLEIDAFPRPQVILVVGVNGSGKTTTIAKLAHLFREQDYSVLLAAGDTFRAAAIEQLRIWAGRAGVPVIAGPEGSDSSAIVFDGVRKATAEGIDVLIVDTAGRLQNKKDLMDELAKIRRVLGRLNPAAPHDVVLVLDATTGQNALAQIEVFRDVAGVTGLVMTKLDGTARGGVMVAAADRYGLPIHAIGVGEGMDDLRPFDAAEAARAIAGAGA